MAAPQLSIRITPSLNESLNNDTARTGISKTDVVNYALAQYLGSLQEISFAQKVHALKPRLQFWKFQKESKITDMNWNDF